MWRTCFNDILNGDCEKGVRSRQKRSPRQLFRPDGRRTMLTVSWSTKSGLSKGSKEGKGTATKMIRLRTTGGSNFLHEFPPVFTIVSTRPRWAEIRGDSRTRDPPIPRAIIGNAKRNDRRDRPTSAQAVHQNSPDRNRRIEFRRWRRDIDCQSSTATARFFHSAYREVTLIDDQIFGLLENVTRILKFRRSSMNVRAIWMVTWIVNENSAGMQTGVNHYKNCIYCINYSLIIKAMFHKTPWKYLYCKSYVTLLRHSRFKITFCVSAKSRNDASKYFISYTTRGRSDTSRAHSQWNWSHKFFMVVIDF